MEAKRKLADVFGTSRKMPLTYVSRPEVDERFLNDITRDKHIVIHGSSKQGKTCLRKHHLKESDYVVVNCTRDTSKSSIYEMILKKAGVSCSVTNSKTVKGSYKVMATVGGKAGIPLIAEGKGKASVDAGRERQTSEEHKSFEIDIEDVNDIVRVLTEASFEQFVVIEDFHYLDDEVQNELSFDLKTFFDESDIVFIVVGVWLENNKLIMYNGDLDDRVTTIPADTWTDDKLREIIYAGEPLLHIHIKEDARERAISLSRGNVGLFQEICYRICEKNEIWFTQENQKEIGSVEQVDGIVRSIAKSKSSRYKNFVNKFSEGLNDTKLEIYKWIMYCVITESIERVYLGLTLRDLFKKIKEHHPESATLQRTTLIQGLERIDKVQHKHKLQPRIFAYSNETLKIVDPNFMVFLESIDSADLLEGIGLSDIA